MMVGVFDRVFETGPVFRAEKHNTRRHLNEYTSLDFEMGYIHSFLRYLCDGNRLPAVYDEPAGKRVQQRVETSEYHTAGCGKDPLCSL